MLSVLYSSSEPPLGPGPLSGSWEPNPVVATMTWGDQEVLESGSLKGEGSGKNVQALGWAFQGAVLVGQGRGEPGVAARWGKVPGKRRAGRVITETGLFDS